MLLRNFERIAGQPNCGRSRPHSLKPMGRKAKVPEHKIKTFLLEYDDVKNYYKDDNDNYNHIYLNVTMKKIKTDIKKNVIVFVCILKLFII